MKAQLPKLNPFSARQSLKNIQNKTQSNFAV